MSEKTVLLTFDYEIYFGKSGTAEKCMLEPTAELLNVFKKLGISATFFVDTIYLQKLKENGNTTLLQKIKDQLSRMVAEGSRIEVHLHPHWVDAVPQGEEWDFPTYKNYRLHAFDPKSIESFFESGTELITSIAKTQDAKYKTNAFRAGGWCLQPFSQIKSHFLKFGIEIDSTVAPGVKNRPTDVQFYNFEKAPKNKVYRFEDDPCLPSKEGSFFEVPITTHRYSLFDKVESKSKRRFVGEQELIWGNGTPTETKLNSKFEILMKRFSSEKRMMTLEYIHYDVLLKKINSTKSDYINFLSHPKAISPYSLEIVQNLKSDGFRFNNLSDYVKGLKI